MRKVNILVYVMSLSFLVGCGGGGTSDNSVSLDNSNNLENQYGYFGGSTKFQKYNIVGNWTFYQNSNSVYARYNEDGSGRHNGNSIDYGVSKNGKQIIYSNGGIINYSGTRTKYLEVTDTQGNSTFFDCYDVEIEDHGNIYENIILCPN